MKRIGAFILIISAFFTSYTKAFSMADTAESACLMNSVTGEVVFSKDMEKTKEMASTTKIMTAIVAIENSKMNDVVTVSENAANVEGSAAYIEKDMKLYMRDLLYGLMLSSGNDAAVAIAEFVAGDVSKFTDMMNNKAKEIGAKNTNFTNPNGLPDGLHYTTAHDLALITRYAMENDEFREIVATQVYTATPLYTPPKPAPIPTATPAGTANPTAATEAPATNTLVFYNHNKLLGTYEGANGVKTGYTDAAGRCLVSSAKRNDMEFIAVTLDDSKDWEEHAEMLDYAFSTHHAKKVVTKGSVIKVAKIDGKEYNMVAAENFSVPLKNKGGYEVDLITHLAQNIKAPINKDEKIGYIEIKIGKEKVGEVDIVSDKDIKHISPMRFRDSFMSQFLGTVKKVLI